MQGTDFGVRRDDWSQTRFEDVDIDEDLKPGQVLFRVDRFALTSNNISYASAGDMLDYWGFFPADSFPADEGWGRIPAMGYGNVIRSNHPEVPEGQRAFGFFPMSKHLVIQADRITPTHYVDAAAHRAKHAPAYRQYSPVDGDPSYDEKQEDRTLLLRGLFMTSFLVDDAIADADFHGAECFVIASASSKTAIALASLLSQRGRGPVIGLTSERNHAFVEGLGFYDQVLLYEDLKLIPADRPSVFIDHSGDGEVVNGVHRHLGDKLVHSCIVGATHWGAGSRDRDLPGAEPTFFFAPGQIQKRSREWGPQVLEEKLGTAWRSFRDGSQAWLRVQRGAGRSDVERMYREVLEGRAKPDQGHVLSLHD